MTTITINKTVEFSKTVFENVDELRDYLTCSEDDVDLDFRRLCADEVTPGLTNKYEASKKKPLSRFISI